MTGSVLGMDCVPRVSKNRARLGALLLGPSSLQKGSWEKPQINARTWDSEGS